jgi:hypothetical protein
VTDLNPACEFCDSPAITTAVQVPVCESHWKEYEAEAKADPVRRPVLDRLLKVRFFGFEE